jgi:hypothetical protein
MISVDVSSFAATVWYFPLGCFPLLSFCGLLFRPILTPELTHLVIFGAAMLCMSLEREEVSATSVDKVLRPLSLPQAAMPSLKRYRTPIPGQETPFF